VCTHPRFQSTSPLPKTTLTRVRPAKDRHTQLELGQLHALLIFDPVCSLLLCCLHLRFSICSYPTRNLAINPGPQLRDSIPLIDSFQVSNTTSVLHILLSSDTTLSDVALNSCVAIVTSHCRHHYNHSDTLHAMPYSNVCRNACHTATYLAHKGCEDIHVRSRCVCCRVCTLTSGMDSNSPLPLPASASRYAVTLMCLHLSTPVSCHAPRQ